MPTVACSVVGPRLILDGPLPVPPPHSLLKTEGVVVVDGDAGHWMNGATLDPYPGWGPTAWDELTGGTIRAKSEGETQDFPDFDPFVAYMPVTCSAFNWERTREKSLAVLEATYSFPVERVLARGISNNPAFGDANMVAPAGSTLVSADVGLAYLENAIGETGRKGMIHATPAIIARLNTDQFLDPDTLTTTNGTPVVSGGGYIGTHPVGRTSASATSDWMFATGPVSVRTGPLFITDIKETLDRNDNTVTFRAERVVLATWDVELQAGVLVNWTA